MATEPRGLHHKKSFSQILKAVGSPKKPSASVVSAGDENDPPVGFVKGLLRRVSSSDHSSPSKKRSKQADEEREAFKSYLRIRPGLPDALSFVETLNDTEVRLHAPDNAATNGILGMHAAPSVLPSTTFGFTRVLGPQTSQPDLFQETALPLVQDVLDGTSGLLFAYGVSNSGKTFTVQGGPSTGVPGVLPRAVDVIFNSIAQKKSLANVRPSRLDGVEAIPIHERTPHFQTYLHDIDITSENKHKGENMAHDQTVLAVSDEFTYAVWISYVEVYNEKIFDLLEAPGASAAQMPGTFSAMSLATLSVTNPSNPYLDAPPTGSLRHKTSFADLKRKALSMKHDKESGHKYVSGATEVRVWSADDARAIMRKGQINRRVYGTTLNQASSRSHGIFTIKIVRVPVGTGAGGDLAASSRLCIVDLAGSERTRNAQTSGDRLKEAGNINKSLMVLGQCLEVIRQNQKREKGKKAQQVPFRHSKLTELFQSFFIGQGRAAMIVCLNPYDTGFEETMHVMRFSAIAKEVTTFKPVAADPSPVLNVEPDVPRQLFGNIGSPPASPSLSKRLPLQPSRMARENTPGLRESTPAPESYVLAPEHRMMTRENTPAPFRESTPALEDFVLAPEPQSETEEEEEEDDGFVDFLLDEIKSLRVQLVETQIESAVIEAQVRQDVVHEMSARMREMEHSFAERMQNMMDAAERKYDQKIAILQKTHDALVAESEDAESDEEDEELAEEMKEAEQLEPVEAQVEQSRHMSKSTAVSEAVTAQNQPPISPAQEPIDIDAIDDIDTPSTTVEKRPEPEMQPASAKTRKSTRKSARKSAAERKENEEPRVLTPRKSRAKPGAVLDRIKAFESRSNLHEDMNGEDGIFEVGKSAVKKKRKLVASQSTRSIDGFGDDEEELRPMRPGTSAVSRSGTTRTMRAGRM